MGSLPHIVEDCMGILQVFSNGTVHRCSLVDIDFNIPVISDDSVVSKDIVFDQKLNLSLRLYKPKSPKRTVSNNKLPVVFYFHGGGFCIGSRVWPNCHNCCVGLASGLDAVVVAPDYRLAPEQKLPAAVEDAVSAVEWLRREALMTESGDDCDAWMGGTVDFDRVFVVGDSSGGNMAHQLAVRLGDGSVKAAPVRVRGYVLLAPFFGGVERTKSEEGPSETLLSLEILDRFWRLSMPKGETRDHPLVNPFGPNSPNLEQVALDPILVIVGGNEILKDRVKSYWRKLKELGKKVEYVQFDGQQHGFFTNDPYSEVSNEALQVIKRFMIENSN